IQTDQLDIFHGLSHELPRGMKASDPKTVVSIHDMIWQHAPQDFPWIDRQFYRIKWKHSVLTADLVLCISEATRQEVLSVYPVNPEKVKVHYQSCDPAFFNPPSSDRAREFRKQAQLPDFFGICVGSLIPRKNHRLILAAVAEMEPKHRFPIFLIGRGSEYANLQKQVDEMGLGQWILFRKEVGFDELPLWYQCADVSLYLSRYEGFGLPVLESMAMGTPVVAAQASSLPEAGGNAAQYVGPDDARGLAGVLHRLRQDGAFRREASQKGKVHADFFRPPLVAKRLLELYYGLLAG
ncbi:MAG: glycosyltransferase family 1 protein, partial [Bacteroidota bacterium]